MCVDRPVIVLCSERQKCHSECPAAVHVKKTLAMHPTLPTPFVYTNSSGCYHNFIRVVLHKTLNHVGGHFKISSFIASVVSHHFVVTE